MKSHRQSRWITVDSFVREEMKITGQILIDYEFGRHMGLQVMTARTGWQPK